MVPTDTEYERLRMSLIRIYQVTLAAIILLVVVFPFWVTALLLIAYYIGYALWVRRVTSTWQRSTERLSVSESIANQAERHSWWMLWFLFLSSLLLAVGGILLVLRGSENWIVGGASVVFFGFCSAIFCRMLVVSWRVQSRQ